MSTGDWWWDTQVQCTHTERAASLSGCGPIAAHNCHLFALFRSCILYYINFSTLFACRYPCASWKLCFGHQTTYTWPPPEIDGEARFNEMIFTRSNCTGFRVAHYLVETVHLVCTPCFFLACFCD